MDIILREEAYEKGYDQTIDKEEEYMRYVQEHINYVKQSYLELLYKNSNLALKSVPTDLLRETIRQLKDDVAVHDASKFSDDEFYAYRVHYYPTNYEKRKMELDESYKNLIEERYNKAWIHHILSNDHHSEHWKIEDGNFDENNLPKDMELKSILHMVCDWEAMSKKFKTDTYQWYQDNFDKSEKSITPNTKIIVEDLLESLFVNRQM